MIISVADVKVNAKELRVAHDDGHVVGSVRFVSCGSDSPHFSYKPVGLAYDLMMMPDSTPDDCDAVLSVVRDEAERAGCRCVVDCGVFDYDEDLDDLPF